jgi:hypothetical protein
LIAEHGQYPEVDLVGSVGIGRVPFRLDIRGVVVQQVVHVMALVLVGADDLSVDRRGLRLNALTIAAGVALVADIVFLE